MTPKTFHYRLTRQASVRHGPGVAARPLQRRSLMIGLSCGAQNSSGARGFGPVCSGSAQLLVSIGDGCNHAAANRMSLIAPGPEPRVALGQAVDASPGMEPQPWPSLCTGQAKLPKVEATDNRNVQVGWTR